MATILPWQCKSLKAWPPVSSTYLLPESLSTTPIALASSGYGVSIAVILGLLKILVIRLDYQIEIRRYSSMIPSQLIIARSLPYTINSEIVARNHVLFDEMSRSRLFIMRKVLTTCIALAVVAASALLMFASGMGTHAQPALASSISN